MQSAHHQQSSVNTSWFKDPHTHSSGRAKELRMLQVSENVATTITTSAQPATLFVQGTWWEKYTLTSWCLKSGAHFMS